MNPRRLLRAEYVCRPAQLFRRLWRQLNLKRSQARTTVLLPWGFPIIVDPRESIGRSIVALSALDLPVTETIWRLLDEGETCADIGANIGYMTSVMAARLRRGGSIWSFEPIPEINTVLHDNVAAWRSLTKAPIQIRPEALTEHDGTDTIHLPSDFAGNRGTASLTHTATTAGRSLSVPTRRLDGLAGENTRFGLLKVDVEGAEARVFRGAEKLFAAGRVRDVVFEEHRPPPAESLDFLRGHGFAIFRVRRSRRGPLLSPPEERSDDEIDPPTFLATLDIDRTRARFAPRGWLCLRS